MKKRMIVVFLLAGIFLYGSSVWAAQAINVLYYMDLVPGKWQIQQKEDAADGTLKGYTLSIVSKQGTNLIKRSKYGKDGDAWVFSSAEVYRIDGANIFLLYSINSDQTTTRFSPAFKLPRVMHLNQRVTWAGKIGTVPHTLVATISQSGLAVTTPAGAFEKCIRFHLYKYRAGDGEQVVQTSVMAPGRNDVATWQAKLEDNIEQDEDSPIEIRKYLTTEYGDSEPPDVQ